MDKRVESRQADCLDGGSTPPNSTRKERTSVLSFLMELTLSFLHSSLNPSFDKGGTWSKREIFSLITFALVLSFFVELALSVLHSSLNPSFDKGGTWSKRKIFSLITFASVLSFSCGANALIFTFLPKSLLENTIGPPLGSPILVELTPLSLLKISNERGRGRSHRSRHRSWCARSHKHLHMSPCHTLWAQQRAHQSYPTLSQAPLHWSCGYRR